jgi:hypothetical protein
MNVAYKHLQSKLRWRELTFGQWASIALGAILAGVWGLYLSPLPPYLSLFSSIYLGGIPAMAAFIAAQVEFDLWRHVRWALAWRSSENVYRPGPGTSARGYAVQPTASDTRETHATESALDLDALWD